MNVLNKLVKWFLMCIVYATIGYVILPVWIFFPVLVLIILVYGFSINFFVAILAAVIFAVYFYSNVFLIPFKRVLYLKFWERWIISKQH